MAKLAFSKLNKIKSLPSSNIDLEGNTLEIKAYLPLADKIQLLIDVLELSGADEGYFNLIKLETFFKIEVIKNYTNISFTDKQMEDPTKVYDQIELNGIWKVVKQNIPEKELDYIWGAVVDMAREITTFNRSFMGMFKNFNADYSALDTEATKIQKLLSSPEIAETIKYFLPDAGLTE